MKWGVCVWANVNVRALSIQPIKIWEKSKNWRATWIHISLTNFQTSNQWCTVNTHLINFIFFTAAFSFSRSSIANRTVWCHTHTHTHSHIVAIQNNRSNTRPAHYYSLPHCLVSECGCYTRQTATDNVLARCYFENDLLMEIPQHRKCLNRKNELKQKQESESFFCSVGFLTLWVDRAMQPWSAYAHEQYMLQFERSSSLQCEIYRHQVVLLQPNACVLWIFAHRHLLLIANQFSMRSIAWVIYQKPMHVHLLANSHILLLVGHKEFFP